MKNQKETKLFAFKLSQSQQNIKAEKQWKTRDSVSTAGCSGIFTRADDYYRGKDQGVYC